MNLDRQLIVSGIIFTLHNTEEAIGFYYFNAPEFITVLFNNQSMILSIIIITIIAWAAIFFTYKSTEKVKANILTTLSIIFLLNAFFHTF